MRLLRYGLLSSLLSLPLAAQSPETGEGPPGDAPNGPRALPVGDLGDPGVGPSPAAAQDAEASREKLLKAADQLDNIEANSESTKAAVDGLKTDLAALREENATLKTEIATLQDTMTRQQEVLDHLKAEQIGQRQALIDEVSAMVAAKGMPHHLSRSTADADDAPPVKKQAMTTENSAAQESATPAPPAPAPSLAPSPEAGPVALPATGPAATSAPAAPTHPHKGYYHVVEAHETLSLIAEAYRANGVDVTVAQIRHANGLPPGRDLKVGQKLFIPKPGT